VLKTAARLHRAAHQNLHVAHLLRQADALHLGNDLELNQQVGHGHVGGRPVEDDAHRSFRRMGADEDDGPGEPFVHHPRHRHEKLPIEVS
jgi:hypothetical protein